MKSHGFRSGTRSKFKKDIRKHGKPNTTTYLQKHKNGDYVDIVINSAATKDMPHKTYHGRTGKIYKADERTVGVKVKRIIGNKQIEERLNIRIEHLKPSRCREEFLARSREYHKLKQESPGIKINPKRIMEGPRKEFFISRENNEPIEVNNIKHIEIW